MSNTQRWDCWKQKIVNRSPKEIRDTAVEAMGLLETAIEKQRGYVEMFAGEDNPQIVESRIRAEAKQEALQAALDALRGHPLDLKLHAIEEAGNGL